MKAFKKIVLGLVTLASATVFAGPEHDHGAPTFQAPKGGILKSTHSAHFELVKNEKVIAIYAYNHEGKGIQTSKFKASAELELPRKKAIPLGLNDKGTHWEATVEAQSAHRFSVKLNIDDGKEKDNVTFTVENK